MKIIGLFRYVYYSIILFFKKVRLGVVKVFRIVFHFVAKLGMLQEHEAIVFSVFFIIGYLLSALREAKGNGTFIKTITNSLFNGHLFTKDGIIVIAFLAIVALIAKWILFRILDFFYRISASLLCTYERYYDNTMDIIAKRESSYKQLLYGSQKNAANHEMEEFKKNSNYYLNHKEMYPV